MRVTPLLVLEGKLEKVLVLRAASLSFPLTLPDHYSCRADRLHYHSAKDQLGNERDSTCMKVIEQGCFWCFPV